MLLGLVWVTNMPSKSALARADRRRLRYTVPHDSVVTDEVTETEGNQNGTLADNDFYGSQYPVQREKFHPTADSIPADRMHMSGPDDSVGIEGIDREVDGKAMGRVDAITYSTGVTSSDLVENFELDGRQQIIRRGPNPASKGPVGTSDASAFLALAYAQSVNQFYPNEESQADLIRSV